MSITKLRLLEYVRTLEEMGLVEFSALDSCYMLTLEGSEICY